MPRKQQQVDESLLQPTRLREVRVVSVKREANDRRTTKKPTLRHTRPQKKTATKVAKPKTVRITAKPRRAVNTKRVTTKKPVRRTIKKKATKESTLSAKRTPKGRMTHTSANAGKTSKEDPILV